MLKRPHYIALGIVALLALILLNLPSHTAARVKLALGSLFLPLFGLASTAHHLADQATDALTPRTELLKQNEALRRQNQQLRIKEMQARELARQNARLRQRLDWQRSQPWKLKLADVILRDPANWWRTVQINLGSRDGVRPDFPVLTAAGLVGRIASVSLTRSQVVLLGNPDCRVGARVVATRDTGVIEGGGSFDASLLTLDYLSGNSVLKPGQEVVTSGLGGIYPKGIPIGRIVDATKAQYGLYSEARVKLDANLGRLEEVWVLFP